MNKEEYKALVKKITPKENKVQNAGIAFLVGGLIGIFGEIIVRILTINFDLPKDEACIWLSILVILLASIFTALGFFDSWVSKARAGLIIPISGFAHSITSSALDYKKDGLITGLGANVFKLAGSVILYSMLSAFFLCLVRVIISG